jgi:hypothetical protein
MDELEKTRPLGIPKLSYEPTLMPERAEGLSPCAASQCLPALGLAHGGDDEAQGRVKSTPGSIFLGKFRSF